MGFAHKKMCQDRNVIGNRKTVDAIKLINPEGNRTLEGKEGYKYLVIFKVDTIKQAAIKQKIRKVNLSRTRKILDTKLCSRNSHQ